MDESEGEEIVVTAQRLRESGGGGGGGDWGWASFYSTSGGSGADSFDFGGGGGGDIVVTAPEEPAEEDTPPEDEIVVTAPEPPTVEAFQAGAILTNWAFDNVVGDFRVTLNGDTAKLEFFDVLTGEHVKYVHFPEGQFWTEKPFDVDSYQHDPAFFQAPAYETQHLDWL